jgi:hypothetical protein
VWYNKHISDFNEQEIVKKVKKKTNNFEDASPDSSVLKNPAEITTPGTESALIRVDKENIVAQVIKELAFARRYKQGKIANWQRNEMMYYGKKQVALESRANVDLARMQEHVHTILSKIDDPLVFKFSKRKASQLKKVERLNALRSWDSQRDFWDIKDIVGKKQALIYGRAAYVYYADSVDGYRPHLENIDIYDLLVDPSGGGVDVEQMLFWGRYGILKSKEELVAMKDDETDAFMKESLQALIDGSGNNTESTQEETNKWTRMYGQNTIGKKELQSDEKYKFWQWFTTYKGTRYVVTFQSSAGRAIAIEPLNELFASNLWPLWTYAAFMDMTEFWTPSYCDYVREIFQVQNVNINQMLDNAEAINKPMKVVNVGMIENLAELKYRRDGIIKTRGDFDANKVIQPIVTPQIDTPIKVFQILDAIQEKATGVTPGDKGAEDTRGKVAIYQGNQEATRGRYNLFNRSYSFGYDRFAMLWQWGVKEHLIKKVAVDLIGPDGIETEEIKRNDIFKKTDNICSCFRVKVESANQTKNEYIDRQNAKVAMLEKQMADELQLPETKRVMNYKKAFEIKAKTVGFNEDEVKELLDLSEYADEELMAEAAEDIESILEGEKLKPNPAANNAYKQKFVDFMRDHGDDMDPPIAKAMIAYVRSLDQVIYKNMASDLLRWKTSMVGNQAEAAANPATPPPAPQAPTPGPTGGPLPVNPVQ